MIAKEEEEGLPCQMPHFLYSLEDIFMRDYLHYTLYIY
jgi:hypothetical protein